MIKIIVILTIAVAVGQCLALCGLFGSSLVDKYKEINAHLIGHVDSSDVEKNMEEIQTWYKSGKSSEKTKEAQKQLLELKKALLEPCSLRSVDILETNQHIYDKIPSSESKRVGVLIKHYVVEHYKTCAPHYVDLFNELKGIDPTIEKAVTLISKTIAEDALRNQLRHLQCGDTIDDQIQNLCTSFISAFQPNGAINEIIAIYNALRKRAVGFNEQSVFYKKYINDRRRLISSLYDKYLVDPCKYYLTRTEEIFKPALFDAYNKLVHRYGYFDEAGVDPYKYQPKRTPLEYYKASLNYQVCKTFFVQPTKQVKNKVLEYAIKYDD